ncbi:MAG TPA: tetratricopeptide repeat protein [Flavitalea sp.]|nr:tetratricopeptide repeat protein [Flavitalea sp.]
MKSLKTKILAQGRLFLLAVSGFLVWPACNEADTSHARKNDAQILNAPPFDGLTDSIQASPNDAALYFQRAALLSQNNLHEIASADYKRSWELSGDEQIALEYASNLILSGNIQESISLLEECAKKFPENAEFSRRLAESYLHIGEPDKALDQYDALIAYDSSNFEAWFDKGSLLARMRDTIRAIEALERSFDILPINYSGLALANLYAARKDQRALEVCNILLAKDSSGAQTEPLYLKGTYYAENNEPDKALELFDECIQRDWKMTDAYIEKGIIFFERKDFDEALKTFTLAATVSNTDPDAYFWMGRCYESMNEAEQAAVNYERAYALDRSFAEAREALKRINR